MEDVEEIKKLEAELAERKNLMQVKQVITSMLCPICGHPLRGYVQNLGGDCCEFQAHIICDDGCGYFHAKGTVGSYYTKGATNSLALECLMQTVRPWIKNFASPLEYNI